MKPSIASSDFQKLRNLLKRTHEKERHGLEKELKKAAVIDDVQLDKKTVRLNSYVEVADLAMNKVLRIKIVLPDCVDLKKRWISVFAPLSSALLGYREEDQVSWSLGDRQADLKILKVLNE